MKTALATLCLALLAPVVSSQQPVNLTGQIEQAPPGPCNVRGTHRIACTNVLLYSATIDLEILEGQVVDLQGQLDVQFGCVAIDVQGVTTAVSTTNTLALLGYNTGSPIIFTTDAPLGSLVSYWFSTGPGFVPLGPVRSLLLDPFATVYGWTDISVGVAVRLVTIPACPPLVGTTFYMQASRLSLSPFGARLLNPTCFTVAN